MAQEKEEVRDSFQNPLECRLAGTVYSARLNQAGAVALSNWFARLLSARASIMCGSYNPDPEHSPRLATSE